MGIIITPRCSTFCAVVIHGRSIRLPGRPESFYHARCLGMRDFNNRRKASSAARLPAPRNIRAAQKHDRLREGRT
jgi:hypothetical protein